MHGRDPGIVKDEIGQLNTGFGFSISGAVYILRLQYNLGFGGLGRPPPLVRF